MKAKHPTIAIVYNLESETLRGEPRDIIALQETAEIAHDMTRALEALGYRTLDVPIRASLDDLQRQLSAIPTAGTLVFNVCDDFGGQSMGAARVARVIEEMGFMYTGETTAAAEICIDKALTKNKLIELGVPTAPFQVFDLPGGDFNLNFPVIVKPVAEDASFGIDFESVVCNLHDLFERVGYVLRQYRQPALVEEFVTGREITAGILGNEQLEFLPIGEVDYSCIPDPFKRLLTYEAKWLVDSPYYQATPVRCPAELNEPLTLRVKSIAEAAYRAVGLRDYGRIDMRFSNGCLYVLDINEAPDLSPDAGFFTSATAAGYSYGQLLERIIDLALTRAGYY